MVAVLLLDLLVNAISPKDSPYTISEILLNSVRIISIIDNYGDS